ncbi:SPFH domain-containing protein [Clostridium sp.]|uniref:SPFH domain-containing protein n=1 Tax=Clostridium sp. TaxID=1506 RepID=UPI002FC5EB9B
MEDKKILFEEKEMNARSGMGMLIGNIALIILAIAAIILSASLVVENNTAIGVSIIILSIGYILIIAPLMFIGLKVVNPNEALVLTLFGEYKGVLKKEGFYWVNPFCTGINPTSKHVSVAVTQSAANKEHENSTHDTVGKKISLKAITLENRKQKVNDELGNPIEIGAVVIWKVRNASMAVFNVDNYKNYISTQCDSVIRNVARCYPYDTNEVEQMNENSNEKSLRGSSQEVASIMQRELQEKVDIAGLEVLEVRITHLSYAPEIASAMLQRQQAVAIIAARQKIVEGAVGMVQMALTQLSENQIVELDDERKAAMVSNLLVVLCGNKDAQPIVNSGSIY